MARTLPWATKTTASTPSPRSSSAKAPSRKQSTTPRTATPTRDEVQKPTGGFEKPRNGTKQIQPRPTPRSRNGSSSPPPAPPPQEVMRTEDRAWIMVEDELYSIAQQYTKHLHHAEYKRLQKVAAERSMRITEYPRPVDGQSDMHTDSKMAKRAEKHRQKMSEVASARAAGRSPRKSTANPSDDEDSAARTDTDEEIAIGDRNLAGLMRGTSARTISERRLLEDVGRSASITRTTQDSQKQNGRAFEAPGPPKAEERLPVSKRAQIAPTRDNVRQNGNSNSVVDDEDLDAGVVQPKSSSHVLRVPQALPVPPSIRARSKILSTNEGPPKKKLFQSLDIPPAPAEQPVFKEFSSITKPVKTKSSLVEKQPDTHFDDFCTVHPKALLPINRPKLKRPADEDGNTKKSMKLEEIPTFLLG